MKRISLILAASVMLVALAGTPASASSYQTKVDNWANDVLDKPSTFKPPLPSVEYSNYNKAQRLYASPTTIQWCTTTWGNASAPLVTFPIAGKLTSSSVSLLPSTRVRFDNNDTPDEYTPERRSVDGMYHGTPPPYRYGFTPGGQYVDLFNMPTLCTTAMTKFQRQATKVQVSVDPSINVATTKAEAALKAGNPALATRLLRQAVGS